LDELFHSRELKIIDRPFQSFAHSEREREREREMSSSPGTHSLAFRVMRLCRPSFHVDPPLRLDPVDLIAGEDILDDPIAASHLPRLIDSHIANPADSSDLTYRSRFLLHDPSDPMGLSGLLVLPQSFGSLSLSLSLLINSSLTTIITL
jgi:hypothetical protein